MANMIRYGWFAWDGDKAVFTETGQPLPVVWQRNHYRGERVETANPPFVRDCDDYEGLFRLENGCSAWLFGTLRHDLWEVTMYLYAPCPDHKRLDETDAVRVCEFYAIPGEEPGTVTQPSNCKGFYCEGGCFHHKGAVSADPGDESEFWETMRAWSGLQVVNNPDLLEHNKEFDEDVSRLQ